MKKSWGEGGWGEALAGVNGRIGPVQAARRAQERTAASGVRTTWSSPPSPSPPSPRMTHSYRRRPDISPVAQWLVFDTWIALPPPHTPFSWYTRLSSPPSTKLGALGRFAAPGSCSNTRATPVLLDSHGREAHTPSLTPTPARADTCFQAGRASRHSYCLSAANEADQEAWRTLRA